MTDDDVPTPQDVMGFLDTHPAVDRPLRQFMALYDAAEALDDLKPPYGETAAAFLREVGLHVMRELGVGEDFVQALIASRPVAFPPVTEKGSR
jgi:hypothetical protein